MTNETGALGAFCNQRNSHAMTPDRDQLRKARLLVNLSLAEVGTAVNSGRAAVSRFEAGKKQSDPELARKLVDLYEGMGVRFDENGVIKALP